MTRPHAIPPAVPADPVDDVSAATAAPRRRRPDLDAVRRDPVTAVAWAALVIVTGWTLWGTLTHDFRSQELVGDQSSPILQTLSMAHSPHDLAYDVRDLQAWRALEWEHFPNPNGLYSQRWSGGWAFAKPYAYSLTTTPPYRVLGAPVGFAVVNSALLLATVALVVAIARTWLRGPAVPLLALAFTFASNAHLHAYPIVVDLFLCVGTGLFALGAVRYLERRHLGWGLVAFAAAAVLLSEKLPMLVALAPLGALVLARASWRDRAALVGVLVAVFAAAVVPYLHYSDGASWTAYGGERYYAYAQVPFDPDSTVEPLRVSTDETITLAYIREQLGTGLGDSARSAVYYLVGRHVGLLVAFPVALLVGILALAQPRRWRHEAVAAGLGILAYVGLYLLLFPDNFYGGGQAMGNRYFLQIAPLVVVVAAGARIPERRLVGASIAAIALSLVLQWPHHVNPQEALLELDRTTAVQRWLPFESNQLGADYWRCGVGVCPADDDG